MQRLRQGRIERLRLWKEDAASNRQGKDLEQEVETDQDRYIITDAGSSEQRKNKFSDLESVVLARFKGLDREEQQELDLDKIQKHDLRQRLDQIQGD